MKTVYLAGPMTGKTFEEANKWRKDIEGMLKYYPDGGSTWLRALNPFRGKENLLKDTGKLKPFGYKNTVTSDQGITSRDRNDTTKADCIIMNLLGAKTISAGTMVELGWADMARVPVIVVMEPEGNPHDHCMVRSICTYRVTSIEEAVILAKNLLNC